MDAPKFHSTHFPSSFYPHGSQPGGLVIEGRVGEVVLSALREKGHQIQAVEDWSNGRVVGIRCDMQHGVFSGVASPRMETGYAMGW